MCHFQVPLAAGTCWSTLSHTHTLSQPLRVSVCKLTLKICSFHSTFYSPFSIFTLCILAGVCCGRYFVLIQRALQLSLLLPFSVSFFQVRSTVNRIKERRKALNFSVCNLPFSCEQVCVHVFILLCVCDKHWCDRLNFPYSVRFSWKKKEKNSYYSNATKSLCTSAH